MKKGLMNAYRQYKIACLMDQKRSKKKWLKEIHKIMGDYEEWIKK